MADTLKFSLVSPERELYSGDVDQVDIPGTEGNLGVLPNHSPLMAAVRTGLVTIYKDGVEEQFFVRGGFADVTPSGLTLLAEQASHADAIDHDDLNARIAEGETQLETLEGEAALSLRQDLDGMRAVLQRSA